MLFIFTMNTHQSTGDFFPFLQVIAFFSQRIKDGCLICNDRKYIVNMGYYKKSYEFLVEAALSYRTD